MRVLVIASAPITGDDLRSALRDERAHDAEVMIIARTPGASALRFLMSDADEALASAHSPGRERGAGPRCDERHVPAGGEVDVATAITDALVTFRADRVLLFAGRAGREGYRERLDPEALEFELGLPVERVELATHAAGGELNGRWLHALT